MQIDQLKIHKYTDSYFFQILKFDILIVSKIARKSFSKRYLFKKTDLQATL